MSTRKPRGHWKVKQNVLDSAQKYTYITEWEKSSERSAVQNARDNGWLEEATKHMEIIRVYGRTDEEVKAIKSEYNTRYRATNYEKLKAYEKQYDYDRRESKSIKTKKFYSENRERLLVVAKDQAANRTPEQQENNKKYHEQYREKNAAKLFIRQTLHRFFEQHKNITIEQVEDLMGYNRVQLRQHIENQFVEGMSWENRSEWHIDHIKPIAVYVKEGITDPNIVNALTNLKPLWAFDNISKGSSYDPEIDLPTKVHQNVYELIK